jgi:ubiquinone/menaquinone biosynthesis C-methylase UbiE
MALLIVNFIPDAPKAAKEVRRVTKSGGVVADHNVGRQRSE